MASLWGAIYLSIFKVQLLSSPLIQYALPTLYHCLDENCMMSYSETNNLHTDEQTDGLVSVTESNRVWIFFKKEDSHTDRDTICNHFINENK